MNASGASLGILSAQWTSGTTPRKQKSGTGLSTRSDRKETTAAMQNEQVEMLTNAIGSTAEMLWLFYSELIHQGFGAGEASAFCLELLRCLVIKDYGRPKDAE